MRRKAGETRPGWLVWVGFFAAVMLLAAVLTVWGRQESPAAIAAHLASMRPALGLWRLGLVLVGGWLHWVETLGRHHGFSAEHRAQLQRLRWRVAAWLIVLELMLVQGVAVRALSGPAG